MVCMLLGRICDYISLLLTRVEVKVMLKFTLIKSPEYLMYKLVYNPLLPPQNIPCPGERGLIARNVKRVVAVLEK